jgi:uncharacterized membrane protein
MKNKLSKFSAITLLVLFIILTGIILITMFNDIGKEIERSNTIYLKDCIIGFFILYFPLFYGITIGLLLRSKK